MDFDFLTEAPSKEDRFNGGSHQLVADSIVNVFENKPDIHIVGLEGMLGSGKSTVIELIKENPDCKSYKFFVFDVEQHHSSSIKKAFISLFANWISGFCDATKKEYVINAKDKALGNVLEYEKKNRSSISWWTIGFVISLLFSASSIKPLISHLDLYFTENNFQFFCMEFFIWLFLFIFPGILLFVLAGISKFYKSDGKDSKIPTAGDLFKRNTIDTITEKLEVTREVGSVELRDSMTVFVQSIPSDIKCIVVIDNLDRVSPDKVREVWSDLEIFISLANSSLKIILPFSNQHIAAALSEDDDGYEFIAKRIPVSFRVPPIVSVGWQETFEKFWRDATKDIDAQTIKVCADILDLLLPSSFSGHVTPRLMKRYINDIYSLKMTTPVAIHPAVSAFYITAVVYGGEEYTVESIIEIPAKNDLIGTVHKKLNLIANNDNEWPVQIMCLHYQTTPEIAKSELLTQPLERALKQHDAHAFIERSNVYGFREACEKIISNNSYIDTVKLTNALLLTDKEFLKSWFSDHVSIINYELYEQLLQVDNQKYDADLVDALLNIVKSELPINIGPINILYDKNLDEVKQEIQKGESVDFEFDGLASLYSYSELIQKVPEIVETPTGDLFISKLWDNRNDWLYWGIENAALTSEQVGNALLVLYHDPNETPPTEITLNILQRINLGWFDFAKGINDKPAFTTNGYNGFIQNIDATNVHDLVFDNRWFSQDLLQHYTNYINRCKQASIKEELIAQALVNIIQRGAYTVLPQWKSLVGQSSGYVKYLPMYLSLVTSFSLVIDALDRPEISEVLKEPLSDLIVNGKIKRLVIKDVLTRYYSVLKTAVTDAKALIAWTEGWRSYLDPDEIDLDSFDDVFIVDVLSLSEQFKDYKGILYSKIDTVELDTAGWVEQIVTRHLNTYSIIEHMNESSYCLSHASNLISAIEELFCTAQHVDSLATIEEPKIFDALFAIIKDDLRSGLIKKLSKALLIQSLPDVVKERLIICLGSHISLPTAKERVDQIIIKDLLISITMTQDIAEWFDEQSFYFKNWKKEDLLEVAKCIDTHKNWFNNLLTDKHLVKMINKIQESEEKIGGEG